MANELQQIVVVGASLAGLNAAETLREQGFDGKLTLIGAEPSPPYDRPPLSKQLLTGEWDTDRLPLRSQTELDALQIEWRLGRRATALDLAESTLRLEDGEPITFDALIIATGASPISLPGSNLEGVHTLRTDADALAIRAAFEAGGPVAVVGGGFIGAEVASAARARGLDVTLIEALDAPMLAPLGEQLAGFMADLHRGAGVDLRTGARVVKWLGGDRIEGLRLDNGDIVEASTVIVGVGVRPTVDWLADSGLSIGDGIICDQYLRAAPRIFAAGDVCRWPNALLRPFAYAEPQPTMRVEHWTNAVEQGAAAAANLLAESRGEPLTPFAPIPYFWSDQHGVTLMAAGIANPRDVTEIAHGSLEERRFAALFGRHGYLSGVVTVAWPRMLRRYQSLIRERAEWSDALAAAREVEG